MSETGTRVAETTPEGYEVVDRRRISIDASRVHTSPSELPLTLNGPIEIDVILCKRARGESEDLYQSEDMYHILTRPSLGIDEGSHIAKSGRAKYVKIISNLLDPAQTFRLSSRIEFDSP